MSRGLGSNQVPLRLPARLQADLARAVAAGGDLLITGRLGSGRNRAAQDARLLLGDAFSGEIVQLDPIPPSLPSGPGIFVGGLALRPIDLPGRRVAHVAVHPWTPEEVRAALPAVDSETAAHLHKKTGGHFSYLDAWHAAGCPSDLSKPDIWQSAVDRALAALSHAAAAVCEELACGFRVLDAPVAPSLSEPGPEAARLMDELDDAALLTQAGELVPVAVASIERRIAPYRRHLLRLEFLRQIVDPTPHEALLLHWAEAGLTEACLHQHLIALANRVRWREPDRALRLYAATSGSGESEGERLAGIAESALLAGDPARARDAAEAALTLASGSSLARALSVIEKMWLAQGLPRLAAELDERYGAAGSIAQCASGFLTHVRVGDLPAARKRWSERPPGTPTTIDEIACLRLVDAIERTVTAPGGQADGVLIERLANLGPELSLECRVTTGWIEVVTALALASGRAATAAQMLTALSDAPDFTADHRLLHALAALRSGQPALATELLDQAQAETLTPRGEFLAAGVALAVALYRNDRNALIAGWPALLAVVDHCEPDLFGLVVHPDIAVAAARLRESAAISQTWSAAHTLLGRLHYPATWTNLIDWAQIQSAILTEQPEEIREPAQRLGGAADFSPQAAVLAEAGRIWIGVLARSFDPREVLSTVQDLAQAGVPVDAARLASHAAVRCDDEVIRRDLLEMARITHQVGTEPTRQTGSATTLHLSVREVQVASLVVEHRSYREIGEALFLSPRTVENHMARIRRRAGARTRRELLDTLRQTLRELGHLR